MRSLATLRPVGCMRGLGLIRWAGTRALTQRYRCAGASQPRAAFPTIAPSPVTTTV